ncbi:MAG: hypothetical protein KGI27_14735, partial [Thaumarchaeota archaeon]|nr:hypothetical protein [Nitrososphaerota archaeon]
ITAVTLAVLMYYHIYPITLPGEKQSTLPIGEKFCYPWQTGCDNAGAIQLKQSSSYYTNIQPQGRP